MDFIDLGRMAFEDTLKVQIETIAQIAAGSREETVHFVEHPHVFTLGRGGEEKNLLSRLDREGRTIDLVRTGRGGDVTYHGPGQLVVYPHLDLRGRGRDVHRYLRDLETVLIEVAADFEVDAYRRPDLTGVWTSQGKLASIGVGVRRWVTLHGCALNVAPDLRFFESINPCGIPDCPVTSLSVLLKRPIRLDEVLPVVRAKMRHNFSS